MRFNLKRRTQAMRGDGEAHHSSGSPAAAVLPDSAFAATLRPVKRRPTLVRFLPLIFSLCLMTVVGCAMALISVALWYVYSPDTFVKLASFLYNSLLPVIPPRLPQLASLVVEPARVHVNASVALLVPVLQPTATLLKGSQLLRELLRPLLVAETALCHRADDGAAVPAVVHAVVASRVSAAALRAAVRGVVAAGTAADGVAVGDGGAGAALTPGARWRAWELSAAAVRRLLGVAGGGGGGGGCLADAVTVVGHTMGGDGAVYTTEPAETLEVLVDAALRTRGGSVGTHFIVLPSLLAASRMAYTEPDDAAEVRRDGTGLVDALLRTATGRNGGRVAAAQCTILGRKEGKNVSLGGEGSLYPPAKLTRDVLRRLHVLDKGGLTASAHSSESLMPFLTRRFNGYPAVDQRASWEEVVDAVSLQCGIFHRALYNAVGGLAAVRADRFFQEAVDDIRTRTLELQELYALMAPDRGGWALSLRMQEMYPTWQVWGSRGVAVLRDDVSNLAVLPAVIKMRNAALSMWDAYGQSVYLTVTRLQRQRVNVPWRQRGLVTAAANWTKEEAAYLPPVLQYFTDFTEPCCGLNREAMSYIRPLMERYSVRVTGTRLFCNKPGNVLLAAPYSLLDETVFHSAPFAVRAFFHQRYATRARIHFQHMRAVSYLWGLLHHKSQPPIVSIGRSLSELSNIPDDWVNPMRHRVDEVWVTADFFASIYRRRGINPGKVRVVPEAVDVYDYDPANYERQPIALDADDGAGTGFDSQPGLTAAQRVQRYVFFANFKWEDRKGWDVLLGAYWDAFGPHAPPELRGRTTLVIKTKFEPSWTHGVTCATIVRFIEAWGVLGSLRGMRTIDDYPHVVVLCAAMSSAQLTQLYASADAFVFPSKAEGWGLPATEAMAMGLPVLVTDWGGLRRFATPDTCFRIPLYGLAEIEPGSPYGHAEGMKMAVPSRDKTAELMRYVLQHPDHARRVGRRARALMVREMSEEAVADTMDRLFVEALRKKALV